MSPETQTKLREFAQAILHGDVDHRQWLIEAVEQFIRKGTVPKPRKQ